MASQGGGVACESVDVVWYGGGVTWEGGGVAWEQGRASFLLDQPGSSPAKVRWAESGQEPEEA